MKKPESLGARLRIARLDRGMTLQEVSKEVGISWQALSKIELDEMTPSLNRLRQLGKLYQVSFDWLLQ